MPFNIPWCFFLACALALPASAAAPAATILVYGDSLSAGYGLPAERGWPSLLAARVREERLNYKVANASISGETTLGGRNRIDAALRQHHPEIVVVALGANDGLRGAGLDAMRANLEAMIDACRRSNARVLLVGMRLPPNYGAGYTEKFQDAFRAVAVGRKVPLVPFLLEGFAEQRGYFLPDGLHPTAEAQPLILETVWKALRPMLARQPARAGAPQRPGKLPSAAPATSRFSPPRPVFSSPAAAPGVSTRA